MITLSVHLITYNNERHIEETLQSILKQKVTFNYEIVVGDDCSKDNTLQIINEYQLQYPALFNIKKNEKQLGILGNFKATLDRCKGEFIFDIAGDDLLKHDYSLQKMVDVLKSDPNLGFIDSGVDILYEDQKKTKTYSNKKQLESSKNNYKRQLLLWSSPLSTGSCYNKKHLYKFVEFEKYLEMNISFEDYPILVELAMNTDFRTIKESLHIYRIHNKSYSNKVSFYKQYLLKSQEKILFDYFSEKYNFEEKLIKIFNKSYYKNILFLSGYYEEKELGQDTYKMIESKSLKDYIHYWASQNRLFRKFISVV